MSTLDQTHNVVMGVAGINQRELAEVVMGVAGHWGTTLRPHVHDIFGQKPVNTPKSKRTNLLGEKVLKQGWRHACFFIDWTFASCTANQGATMRWRNGFHKYFDREHRRLPLVLDSAAFRIWSGAAERWANLDRYEQAIEVMQPEAYMMLDVIGDQAASKANYDRMVLDGYRPIPVWQTPALYNQALSPFQNGSMAARDPILRYYASQSPMVALGGLLATTNREPKGPRIIKVSDRAEYIDGVVQGLPGVRFWALAQASGTVVNGLGRRGLLDRVSVDGTWWIHTANCEQIVVNKNGVLDQISLKGKNRAIQTYLTGPQIMSNTLLALLSAYAGMLSYPGAARVPTNMSDPDEVQELQKRVEQMSLFGLDAA